MRRGVNGNDALETINAAASAIASAETRAPRASVQVWEMMILFLHVIFDCFKFMVIVFARTQLMIFRFRLVILCGFVDEFTDCGAYCFSDWRSGVVIILLFFLPTSIFFSCDRKNSGCRMTFS